jgi:hypothetical protein
MRSFFHNEQGSIATLMLTGIVLLGVLGVVTYNLLSGPMQTASTLNARNNTSTDLSMGMSTLINHARAGEYDNALDTTLEVPSFVPVAGGLINGGVLPTNLGMNTKDPWGTPYGYCAWDHGDSTNTANMIAGVSEDTAKAEQRTLFALISAGHDKTFSVGCSDVALGRPTGNIGDDIIRIAPLTYVKTMTGTLEDTGADGWQTSGDSMTPDANVTDVNLNDTDLNLRQNSDIVLDSTSTIQGTGLTISEAGITSNSITSTGALSISNNLFVGGTLGLGGTSVAPSIRMNVTAGWIELPSHGQFRINNGNVIISNTGMSIISGDIFLMNGNITANSRIDAGSGFYSGSGLFRLNHLCAGRNDGRITIPGMEQIRLECNIASAPVRVNGGCTWVNASSVGDTFCPANHFVQGIRANLPTMTMRLYCCPLAAFAP